MSLSDSPRESCISCGRERDEAAAELDDRDAEGDPRAGRGLPEDQAERPAGEARRAVELELVGEVEDRLGLRGDEVGDPQQVAAGERDGERRLHSQRSFAAVTAAPTSPSRGASIGGRLERAGSHRGGDLLVGVAERHAVAHERLGGVGRAQQRVGAGGRHPLAVEGQAAYEHRERGERVRGIGARGEHRRLVLLQVAVVGERQALDRREQAGQPADRGAGLAARELGDVGVELLRHHRRAGRGVLGQVREAELGRRPEHDLLADPRQMAEEDRARVQVVEREVSVGDAVDRVAHRVRGRRDREGRAGERARAERAEDRLRAGEAEPRPVAVEHLRPGE